MESSRGKEICVQVALRIRPQGTREKLEGSQICTFVLPNEPQVTIGGDRSFTYDYVFDQTTKQNTVYESCVEKLVDGLFDGFNATVLAYGQTGSGKTHTMGTAFDSVITQKEQDLGVIPRAIQHTFHKIRDLKTQALQDGKIEPKFEVSVQFVELYNDDVLDLLSDDRTISPNIRIHEDSRGEIVIYGVEQKNVSDMPETIEILKNGALNRTVASTNMNEQSSRSHAIFSLHLKQQKVSTFTSENERSADAVETEMLTAKFHFVDLAGSERMKRTGATGDRAKEGISINVGLLALGNVIAALGGANGKATHIPYRDSKLTRLLQDSLGGNSRTLMIACCSPSDSDFVETLNTMKYANRAKEIKNKVMANQDKSSKMIGELRNKIATLEAELLEFKQGRRTVDFDGEEVVNDQYHENVYLTSEVQHLRFRVKALGETLEILRSENIDLRTQQELGIDSSSLNTTGDSSVVETTFRKYLEDLERTKSLLYETQSTCDQLRRENSRLRMQVSSNCRVRESSELSSQMLIDLARKEIQEKKDIVKSSPKNSAATSGYSTVPGDDDETSNDAEDIEDLEGSEDDFEVDENGETEQLQIGLHDVMMELDLKEKLIDQLERAERQNQQIRETYEKKLKELLNRIQDTEKERDKILQAEDKTKGSKLSEDQIRKIKQEYELKISELKKELKKIEALDREHLKIIAKSQRELQEKIRLKSEVTDLKKTKVELIKRMNDDKKKQRAQLMENARTIATKEKQSRLQANKIRTLEMKDQQREQFLKKTTNEVKTLRKEKAQRDIQSRKSDKLSHFRPTHQLKLKADLKHAKDYQFSVKLAKIKCLALDRKIDETVRKSEIIKKLDSELERYFRERHTVMIDIVENEKLFAQSSDIIHRDGLLEAIDSAKDKLHYIQEQIKCQQKLIADVDIQDEVNENDSTNPLEYQQVESIFEDCHTLQEARHLMQHLFTACLNKATIAAKVETENKEKKGLLAHLDNDSIKEDIITILRGNETNYAFKNPDNFENEDKEENSAHYGKPTEIAHHDVLCNLQEQKEKRRKVRSNGIRACEEHVTSKIVTKTHSLEGHARSVLSVDVSENFVVTGSKDRTAKLWDIENQKEIRTLGVHPNNVHFVKFVPFSNNVFTFSMFEARAWDYRAPECICLKVLNSSGQVNDGAMIDSMIATPRQNTIPFLETLITAADVDPTGQMLFTSFAGYVRVWNLKEWKPLGRLNAVSQGPKSEVACIRTSMTQGGVIHAYTGSKDSCVKEYEVGLGTGVIEAKIDYMPTHQDNVTAVQPVNKSLYSASKDKSIFKFSLETGKLEHMETHAHRNSIQSLSKLENDRGSVLISACKGGDIRIWDTSSTNEMKMIDEIPNAHAEGINQLCVFKSVLFTASGDSTVGLWKAN